MCEYTIDNYISFIETGRRDKISPHVLSKIAKSYRELENENNELKEHLKRGSEIWHKVLEAVNKNIKRG